MSGMSELYDNKLIILLRLKWVNDMDAIVDSLSFIISEERKKREYKRLEDLAVDVLKEIAMPHQKQCIAFNTNAIEPMKEIIRVIDWLEDRV